jgi:hypothetical protein
MYNGTCRDWGQLVADFLGVSAHRYGEFEIICAGVKKAVESDIRVVREDLKDEMEWKDAVNGQIKHKVVALSSMPGRF